MSVQRGILGLVAICASIVLLSILGVVWAFTSGLLYPHILLDGLLLLLVCLLMGGVFSLMLFLIAKAEGWLARLPFPRKKSAAEAPAASPANPATEQKK
jgi:hypothetical protein